MPATAPHRFDKAVASGADLVILDLEDAVAPADKAGARPAVEAWVGGGRPVAVRINGAGTPWYAEDVALVRALQCTVVLPKAEPATAAAVLDELATSVEVIALVETAAGVVECAGLSRLAGVTRLAFGALDLAAELGVDPAAAEPVLGHARAALVLASAAAGLPAPVDGVTPAVHDADALRVDLLRSRSTGFGGKLAVHPAQVAAINDAYSPSPAELAWAAEVLAAVQEGEGVTTVRGAMVDAPVLRRARRLISRAVPQEPNRP